MKASLTDLLSRLERVEQTRAFLIWHLNRFPIEKVRRFLALDFAHEAAAGVGARIGGGLAHGFFQTRRVPETFAIRNGQAEAAVGLDLVKFEVLRFEPWMAQIDVFVFAELAQDIFLCDPIDDANEGL